MTRIDCLRCSIENRFDAVINLAAQAGVRYSLVNPDAYIPANIVGFLNVSGSLPAIILLNTSCMPLQAPFMDRIPKCRSQNTSLQITLFHYMRQLKSRTN